MFLEAMTLYHCWSEDREVTHDRSDTIMRTIHETGYENGPSSSEPLAVPAGGKGKGGKGKNQKGNAGVPDPKPKPKPLKKEKTAQQLARAVP